MLTDRRFSDGSYIADPASSQLHECLVKIALLLRMVRAMQRSEALDLFSVGALAQKRSVKQAVRSLSSNPFSGEPLLRELTGLWKYKVRRFRLIYEVDRKARLIRIFALGHRREVYEELADRLRKARGRK